jgi:hypothetical protein
MGKHKLGPMGKDQKFSTTLGIEILYVTNKMQLFMIFITNNALHVSGVFRPSSGAYVLYKQLMVKACNQYNCR